MVVWRCMQRVSLLTDGPPNVLRRTRRHYACCGCAPAAAAARGRRFFYLGAGSLRVVEEFPSVAFATARASILSLSQ